jgi:predicted signal transduction protein with EAL and GGDEF domain
MAKATDATDLARRLIATISRPIATCSVTLTMEAAIGIALTIDGPDEPSRLLARADAAMYRAKHHDRSAIEIFNVELQQQMIVREDVEVALKAALADPAGGGLELHYQPVLDSTSSALVSVEALIRWDRPGHGRLAPDSFIPIAEATSLIIDVDCWVLAAAVRQLAAWSTDPHLRHVPVAVNISGRHLLSRQLPGHITAALNGAAVGPERLLVEITETVILSDLVSAASELESVRALGVKVAIDDFGTGYTSLAHLQKLPIDTIKIDRSFISQLNERRGSSLVRMVTDLGHAIDLNIVAEGVETDEELAVLQAIGADHIQGYLLSRPLPPVALATWVHGRTPVLVA